MSNITKQTFEENLEKLEEIVEQLEQGDLPLEEAIKLFQEGMEISKLASEKLTAVEKTVKKLVAEGEKIQLETFDDED